MEEESPVKTILTGLRAYLHNNLRIDESFISSLSAAGLLSDSDADILRSSVSQGGHKAQDGLLQYMEWYYDQKLLEKFCVFLNDYSKPAKPRLGEIAGRIRQEMEKHQPGPIHQPDLQQQDSVAGPTTTGPPSSPPATQGEPTPTVSTMDERSQKIEEIVDMYRSESTKVSLPEIPELEDDFDNMMGSLNAKLSSADPQVICKLVGMVRLKYRRYIHGVKPVELPSIPNTAGGLYDFIAAKSTPYEILLAHHAVDVLDTEDLKGTLQSYKSNLGNHLRRTLESYKKRKVTLPLRKDHTHLAIVLSKEQTLLSLVLHIKQYLMKYLQLEETIFEGFGEGCTVLFYSILKVDAVLLAPKILSHSAELKRMFGITHLVVFDYFAFDLDRATIELPNTSHHKDAQLQQKDDQLREQTAQLQQKDDQLRVQTAQLQQKDDQLREQTAQLQQKDDQLREQTAQLQQKDDQLREQTAQLQQKDDQLREKDAERKQQQTSLRKKNAQLNQKNAELRLKDEESSRQYAVLLHEHQQLQQEHGQLRRERDQLQQDSSRSLSAKPLQQKDVQLKEKDAERKQQQTSLRKKNARLKQKNAKLQRKDEESGRQYAVLLHEHQQLQQEHDQLRREQDQLQQDSSRSLSAEPVVKKPPRNWKDMKCQKILECGVGCRSVAVKGNHIAVGVPNRIQVYDRSRTKLLHTIGKDQLGNYLTGVSFYDQENILVSDTDNNNIKMFTIQGQHVRSIDRGSTTFEPYGITIYPDGQIYVCDGANHCVCVFDVNGKFLFSFGSRGSGDECFHFPRDLYFTSDGFLYITDFYNTRICVYDKDGKFIGKFTTTYNPTCIDATDYGHLIVSSFWSTKVMIYTTGGDLVHVFGEHGSELGQFDILIGVSVDSDGLIYIADSHNNRIQVF